MLIPQEPQKTRILNSGRNRGDIVPKPLIASAIVDNTGPGSPAGGNCQLANFRLRQNFKATFG